MNGLTQAGVTRFTRDLDAIVQDGERRRDFAGTLDALAAWKERVSSKIAASVSSGAARAFATAGRFEVVAPGDFVTLRQETDKLRRAVRDLTRAGTRGRTRREPGGPERGSKSRARADIVAITIRDDETAAVLSRLSARRTMIGRQRTYTAGCVTTVDGRRLTVASVRTPEQGPLASQNTARDAIDDLDPAWLALVGICGAIPDDDFTLGDVVLASRLHAFMLGALVEGKQPQFSDVGGPMSRKSEDLVHHLVGIQEEFGNWGGKRSIRIPRPPVNLSHQHFYGSSDYQAKTRASLISHFKGAKPRTTPLVTPRPTGTSMFLLKSSRTLSQWRHSARHLAAIEMELAGVYQAARRREKEYPIIAVRGISDIVGFKRDNKWTRYACETAAAFFVAAIRHTASELWSGK